MDETLGPYLQDVYYGQTAGVSTNGPTIATRAFSAGLRARIIAIRLELQASAVAGARRPQLTFGYGPTQFVGLDTYLPLITIRAGLTQAAGTTYAYHFIPGAVEDTAVVDSEHIVCRMPFPIEVWGTGDATSGWWWRYSSINGDAGDVLQFSWYLQGAGIGSGSV